MINGFKDYRLAVVALLAFAVVYAVVTLATTGAQRRAASGAPYHPLGESCGSGVVVSLSYTKGNMSFSLSTMVSEQWNVIFRLDGSNRVVNNKELFQRVAIGDTLDACFSPDGLVANP